MRFEWKQLFPVLAAAASLIPAIAQTTPPQKPGIDMALMAEARGGDTVLQVLVGESFATGKGVTQDLRLAAEWFTKAAEKGDVSGEIHLAELYRDGGKGFPRDMAVAAEWYRKAAEQGDVGAQGTLGVLYSIGLGLPQDNVEAYYWLDLAAAVKGPKQEQYAANRQMIGTHITTVELAEVEERVAKWLAAHPRSGASE